MQKTLLPGLKAQKQQKQRITKQKKYFAVIVVQSVDGYSQTRRGKGKDGCNSIQKMKNAQKNIYIIFLSTILKGYAIISYYLLPDFLKPRLIRPYHD